MAGRVTNVSVEVLNSGATSNARVTSVVAQVLISTAEAAVVQNARATQAAILVLLDAPPVPEARGTQGALSALTVGATAGRAGQAGLLVLAEVAAQATARGTQAALSALAGQVADAHASQALVLVLAGKAPEENPAYSPVVPEMPINEVWSWLTDRIVATDGTEQRIALRGSPRRSFGHRLEFSTRTEVREHVAKLLNGFRAPIAVPHYQYMTRLKAKAAAAATELVFNPQRTDLRNDGWVLILERDTFELTKVREVTSTGCTLWEATANAYTTRANVIPVSVSFPAPNSAISRRSPDTVGSLTITAVERDPVFPFVRPGTTATLTEVGGYPVLERRPVGVEFEDMAVTGEERFDFETGKISARSPWLRSQFEGQRQFLANRFFDADALDYWRVFGDYCKGSVNPFYMPTGREDFDIADEANPGGGTILLAGHDYSANYWTHPAYRSIAISTKAGTHYAVVTACQTNAGDDQLSFTPALPADAEWGQDQSVSLMPLVRLATDDMRWEHHGMHSFVSFGIRTIDG